MDATWFAVDEDGQVAVFDSGEGGAVPEGPFPMDEEKANSPELVLEDDELLARLLLVRAQSDEKLKALLPKDLRSLEQALLSSYSSELYGVLLRSLGVWTYEVPDGSSMPYERLGSVGNPIQVEDFDEDTWMMLEDARLPVRFAESKYLAPGEHLPVSAWGPIWFDRQGKAHPTQGQEQEFERIAGQLTAAEEETRREMAREPAPEELEAQRPLEGDELYEAVRKLLDSKK